MKLGSSRRREQRKRRQRLLFGLVKWSFFLGLVLAAGIYAWYTGSSVAERESQQLAARVTSLDAEVSDLQKSLAEVRAREADLQDRIPSASEQAVLELVRQRVADGVDPDRIAGLVAAVTAEENCEGDLQNRRFRVRTPLGDESGTFASFAGAALTLTADGDDALDDEGRAQAWFDSTKPVRLTVRHVNGATSTAEGTLPLAHAMAVGDTEYRFQLTAADLRGFVTATMDRCAYP
ncbi:MAG: hypothetical protein WEB93_04135 [Sphingomonadales bacterium]